ncbi:MAG: hypothetical protein ACI8TQ_001431 [Planctomycetota bacterium]|jgi:uncharacterized protein (DUF58 family)
MPAGLVFVLTADLCFAIFLFVDWLRTPNPVRFVLDRELPETVGLSNEFERRVRVSADSRLAKSYEIELHEDFPDSFEVIARTDQEPLVLPQPGDLSGGPDRLRYSPDTDNVLRRNYRSARRGQFRMGDLRLSVIGPMGLIKRQKRFAGSQSIVVESALANLRTTLALAASERWRDLGVRRRRRRGGQSEFESLRDYVRGDDVRMIDWKAFARRGKPTVRMFQEERGQELIVMFDCGRRMRSTASLVGGETIADTRWTKLDWAFDAGLQLAAVALQQGDRVGIVVFDDNVQAWVAPARGKRQFSRLREAVYGFQPSRRETNYSAVLRELAVRHRRSATVAILSDVADPLSVEDQRRALASSSHRHKIVFACLDDPEVRQLAEGSDAVQLSETGSDLVLRASAMSAVEGRRLSLRQLAGSGVRVLDALPADAAGPLLTAWLDARRSG